MNFTKDFEEILVDFFKRYDAKNANLVPDIMRKFRQDKRDVIMHLCNRYNVDINSIEGVEVDMASGPADRPKPAPVVETNEGTDSSETQDEDINGEEDAPVEGKSKKKLFMIIGIVVVLTGSVGAYMMFSGGDQPVVVEEVTEAEAEAEAKANAEAEAKAKAEAEAKAKAEAEAKAKAEAEAMNTAAADSAATDSVAAEAAE